MQHKEIQFIDRESGTLCPEVVYGEPWLRFAYNNPLGRMATKCLISRAAVSRWYGRRMNRAKSRLLIRPFIDKYGVDPSEMIDDPDDFASFNHFFSRQLKSTARPIDDRRDHVVFPADGRHLGWQDVSKAKGIFIKGQRWNMAGLLGDESLGEKYMNATVVLSRLCPVDYHRFHYPLGGIAGKPRSFSGPLYSVSPIALRRRASILWTNKRTVTRLEVEAIGDVYLVEIGATMVGSIFQNKDDGGVVLKGQEKGWFAFGGSSVVTIFPHGTVDLSEDLLNSSGKMLELYAKMGDTMGALRT